MGISGFIFLFLAGCGLLADAAYFKFEDCSEKAAIANVSQMVITPDPVDLKKNVTVTVHIRIKDDVPEKAVLKVKYYKLKSVFGINVDVPIPCLLGKFGSCSYPLCKYLKLYKEQAEDFFPEGQEYGCPVKAGEYGGDNMEMKMPDMGSIARYIVGGKYRTELQLMLGRQVLGCYKYWIEMH